MNKLKALVPFLFTLFIIFIFYIKRAFFLKFYPPAVNLFFFLIFFSSLFFKETVIQKTAKLMAGELTPCVRTYTRKLTYVWCIFTFFNFLVSLITVFMSDNVWIVYNGCISYLLAGVLFGLEYAFRIYLRKKGKL